MFFVEFLKGAVPPDDRVTRSFIDCMVPEMMNRYVIRSAKGGSHVGDTHYSEETQRKFEANADQSMLSHLLNGIFPSLQLMNLLEAEGLERFSDVERQVYILSYMMHDVDKIQQRTVETKTRTDIETSKAFIDEELRKCKAEAFFPAVADYVEDITFLVVNTQERWGTHLNTYLWQFRLPERRIAVLRRLCTYSDHIAYLVTSPAEILKEDKLNTILAELSQDKLVFTYHQLREVRGLFTNVVNNGLVHLFTDGREGIWPYLFFSDGVVYIKRKGLDLSISTKQVVEAVKERLQQVCTARIKQDAPGFKFSIQGIAKHPEYYFEFLSLEDYLDLLASSIIDRTRNDITVIPLGKVRQMQANGEIAADLPTNFAPDRRIGMLSRFFSVVFATVQGMLDKAQDALRAQVEREVVDFLELQPYWEQSKTIPNKGGVEYRWFWLGACYLCDHPGIDVESGYAGQRSLRAIFNTTFALLLEWIGDELRQQMQARQQYLNHLTSYLEALVDLPLAVRAGGVLPDFYGEMEGYTNAKGKKARKLICTLCNSAYPTEPQADNAVLFQPWVYKNKLPLYAGANAGGVCAICALELMLRQLLQKGQLRLTGSKFEAMKTKYLAVYPNYFFTAETGAMVQDILDQLWDINFFSLRKQLTGKNLEVRDVLVSELFEAPYRPQPPRVLGPIDDDSEEGDDEEDEDSGKEETVEEQKGPTDRSYIKYEYPEGSYPGLCFFGMRAGKDDNDTASWAMPALLALALPLVTGAKVVISEMLLPLFSSGHDFLETVVFDAPHPYLGRLLDGVGEHKNRVRVNRVLEKLSLLVQVYQVNLETYAEGGRPKWKYLSGIVRDLETDPLYVFSYLRKQERIESKYASTVEEYIGVYRRVCKELLGQRICKEMLDMDLEENLGNIQKCVDLYTVFYRGGYESHSILKPVDIVAKAIINSPLEVDEEDLLWEIQGETKNWLDRVRSRQAEGYAIFWGKDIDTKEAPAIRGFITYFYTQVFKTYCQGERGILRSRLNRFKDGCEAYYVHLRTIERIHEQEQQEPDTAAVSS
jgi:CRISPR-associated protein Csc3